MGRSFISRTPAAGDRTESPLFNSCLVHRKAQQTSPIEQLPGTLVAHQIPLTEQLPRTPDSAPDTYMEQLSGTL